MVSLMLRVVFLSLILSAVLSAELITGVTIYQVSGETYQNGWDMLAIHLVDGSGLTGDVHSSCYENSNCWQNSYWGGLPSGVTFDLNDTYTLDSIHVWNGYWGNGESARSAYEVYISTSPNASDWTLRGIYYFPMAPDTPATYTGFVLDSLGWQDTRYVDFWIKSNYGGSSCGGCITMAEVQFSSPGESGGEVPEPGAFALAGAGAAALLWLRRRG
jgi:hypothetical protein